MSNIIVVIPALFLLWLCDIEGYPFLFNLSLSFWFNCVSISSIHPKWLIPISNILFKIVLCINNWCGNYISHLLETFLCFLILLFLLLYRLFLFSFFPYILSPFLPSFCFFPLLFIRYTIVFNSSNYLYIKKEKKNFLSLYFSNYQHGEKAAFD